MRSLFKTLVLLSFGCCLTACTSFFYFPQKTIYPYYKFEKPLPENLFFPSLDQTRLHAWHFPPAKTCAKAKALIVHYHGNAQNLSTHYRFLHWLTEECYDYYIFDYRSYGLSEGEKDSSGILKDARAALKYFSKVAEEKKLPLITYGQSIGGTLLLRSLQIEGRPQNLAALIIESSFYKFSTIGREKIASFWLTWPLQILSPLLVSNEASPGGRDYNHKNLPTLLIYSKHDSIVPYHHGRLLYKELPEPKWLWSHENQGHTHSMIVESGKYRRQLIQWLDWTSASNHSVSN